MKSFTACALSGTRQRPNERPNERPTKRPIANDTDADNAANQSEFCDSGDTRAHATTAPTRLKRRARSDARCCAAKPRWLLLLRRQRGACFDSCSGCLRCVPERMRRIFGAILHRQTLRNLRCARLGWRELFASSPHPLATGRRTRSQSVSPVCCWNEKTQRINDHNKAVRSMEGGCRRIGCWLKLPAQSKRQRR